MSSTEMEDLIPQVVALNIDDVQDVSLHEDFKQQAPPDRVIYFRDLSSWDIPKVRELHEDWFPIRYNQAFYDGAAQGLWMETGGPLFARLAVEMQPSPTGLQPVSDQDRQEESVLGAVTASTLPLSKVDDPDLIAPDDWEHTHVMYILTLGTKSSVRRMGIASALLQECIAQAARQTQCGAVYLHVKADNISARHFYEKNGFQNLRFLKDYYMIDGVRHDAFLYIRYVNGASPQSGWFDLITRPLFALFSIASLGWRKIIEGFAVEEFEDTTTEKSFEKGKNELDDLLDMLGDDDAKPAPVHPRPTSSRAGAYNSSSAKSSSEFKASGAKKCSQALMDGGFANRGLGTAFSRSACSNLRCNECDFSVVQFPGKKWDESADYMFFRENVPSETKLRAKMEVAPG
ncbi:hypothetical protein PHYBOEH_004831 [Phytophthora boehmeriae]|uniref:histone acetyltransferase n=1 Tax=Phytophthora boehmeriae TaxID=109152 RepID=A0A8T1WMR9_9STRA|nr:hypothetical protein PHYBOEH_004831 [Phytophthora boehmeriae]